MIVPDIDAEDLRAVLEAARWAPSSFGEEPWRFIVARRRDPWRGSVEKALMDGNAWARRASVLVVGLTKDAFTRNGRDNPMAVHDLGIALGGILAEATVRGLATHPMGGFRKDEIVESFDVPDGYTPHWVLAVGAYDPSGDEPGLVVRDQRPRYRRPIGETVFGGRFGEPAALG